MATSTFEGLNDNTVKNAQSIQDSMEEIDSIAKRLSLKLRAAGDDFTAYKSVFNSIKYSARDVAAIQDKIRDSSTGIKKAIEQQAKQLSNVRQLNLKIDELYAKSLTATGTTAVRLRDQARNLEGARDSARELSNVYRQIAEDAASLNNSTQFFNYLSDVVKDIPVLRKLANPFEAAAAAARDTVLSNAKIVDNKRIINTLSARELSTGAGLTKNRLKLLGLEEIAQGKTGAQAAALLRTYQESQETQNSTMAALTGGFKSLIPLVKNVFAPIALIHTAIQGIKFVVELMMDADEQVVDLSKSLGISRDISREIRSEWSMVSKELKDPNRAVQTQYFTTTALLKAQIKLTEVLGRQGKIQTGTAQSYLYLTERIGLAEDAAASLSKRYEIIGADGYNSVKKTIDSIFNGLNGLSKGIITPKELLSQMANVTGEIAASFNFSNDAIAEGIVRVRRYGVNLEQARNIASNLLDFQTSISAELEAELLTGKQLNLEQSRVKALTGDIVGATEEVLAQMQNLTKEQRKSPLIMKAFANVVGLSVDELQNAYTVQTDVLRIEKEQLKNRELYKKEIAFIDNKDKQKAEQQKRALRDKLGLTTDIADQLEQNVTISQKFNETMEMLKDAFSSKFTGETISNAVDGFVQVGLKLAKWLGPSDAERAVDLSKKITKTSTSDINLSKYSDKQKDLLLGIRDIGIKTESLQKAYIEKEKKYNSSKTIIDSFISAWQRSRAYNDYKNTSDYSRDDILNKFEELQKTGMTGSDLSNPDLQSINNGKIKVNDFTIQTHPQDTLMMGGTKLGNNNSETNKLLKDLIAAVKAGSVLEMDSQKVGKTLVRTNSNRLGG